MHPIWQPLPQPIALKPKEIHLIGAALNQAGAVAENWRLLSQAEQDRALRFKFTEHREQFILAHGYLRQVLARFCRAPAAQLQFDFGQKGKPYLKDYPEIQFNLSHSHDQMLIAVCHTDMIGVDIEHIKTCEALSLAERFFSQGEFQQLKDLADTELLQGFYAIWTQKEAYIKATGLGLSTELKQFSVNMTPAGLLEPKDSNWTLESFVWHPAFAGAYAVYGQPEQIHHWQFGS